MSGLVATQTNQGVFLSDGDGWTIYYTLDGSDPMDYIVTDGEIALYDDGELLTTGDVR